MIGRLNADDIREMFTRPGYDQESGPTDEWVFAHNWASLDRFADEIQNEVYAAIYETVLNAVAERMNRETQAG